jgi:hypothetical protein
MEARFSDMATLVQVDCFRIVDHLPSRSSQTLTDVHRNSRLPCNENDTPGLCVLHRNRRRELYRPLLKAVVCSTRSSIRPHPGDRWPTGGAKGWSLDQASHWQRRAPSRDFHPTIAMLAQRNAIQSVCRIRRAAWRPVPRVSSLFRHKHRFGLLRLAPDEPTFRLPEASVEQGCPVESETNRRDRAEKLPQVVVACQPVWHEPFLIRSATPAVRKTCTLQLRPEIEKGRVDEKRLYAPFWSNRFLVHEMNDKPSKWTPKQCRVGWKRVSAKPCLPSLPVI